jgi:hypothetical protein
MYATYQREYENFTHLPASPSMLTMVVNNMRANVDVFPYDDHDRAVKLLHSLDRMDWGGKFEAIVELEKHVFVDISKYQGCENTTCQACLFFKSQKQGRKEKERTPSDEPTVPR